MHDDGFWRLQTVRYESMQLTQNQDSSSHQSSESDKSKDINENQDKFVVVHDQSSEMLCTDVDMETEDVSRPAEAITIATSDEQTGYVLNAADLQGHQNSDLADFVTMTLMPENSQQPEMVTMITNQDGQQSRMVTMVTTEHSQHSHMATLTDIDGCGQPREINVTILEAPEGGYQVLNLSSTKKKEKHMTYNLEMLSDVAITLPGGQNSDCQS